MITYVIIFVVLLVAQFTAADLAFYELGMLNGAWHTVEVVEPSVIYEVKDGRYGEDGSETWDEYILRQSSGTDNAQDPSRSSTPESCLGDLKSQFTYLIGMERQSGSMDAITPLYVSRMLNVPFEDVEKCMREMEI